MIEEARAAYLSIVPPQALKARVLAACKAAKKKRAAVRRRMTAAAACLVLIAGLSVYGLSPVPTLSSQGQAMENGIDTADDLGWRSNLPGNYNLRRAAHRTGRDGG